MSHPVMNAGQEKGAGVFLKYRLFPYFPPAGEPKEEVNPGSAGPLIRRAVVFTRTLLFIDPDEPDCVDLKKAFS